MNQKRVMKLKVGMWDRMINIGIEVKKDTKTSTGNSLIIIIVYISLIVYL